MWVDIVCVLVLLVHAVTGFRRGFASQTVSLLGIGVALLAVWALWHPVGGLILRLTHLQPLLAYPLAAAGLLVAVIAIFGLPARHLRQRRGPHLAKELPGRLAGALLNVAYGGILLTLALGLFMLGRAIAPELVPDVRSSVSGQVSAPLVDAGVEAIAARLTGSAALGASSRVALRDPRQSAAALQSLSRNPRLRALQRNRSLEEAVREGRAMDVARHPGVRALAGDRAFVRDLHRLGLLQGDPEAISADQVMLQLTDGVAPLAVKLTTLLRDPALHAILQDPKFSETMHTKSPLELLNDPLFNQLVTTVVASLDQAPELPAEDSPDAPPPREK